MPRNFYPSPNDEGAMRVAELMQKNVKTVDFDTSVAETVLTLADAHVSALPVLDGHGHMIGVVSSTDVLTAEAEAGANDVATLEALFKRTPVHEIMTRQPITIRPDADVREAAQQMLYADVHRLFVTDRDDLMGVISTTDIVRAVATGRL